MEKKDYQPKVIDTVERWVWLRSLAEAGCPDKLVKTALAVASYVHAVCNSKCGGAEQNPCNDYGWAFPEQATHIVDITGNNESTVSKKIDQLVEQGWLVKHVEKRQGAQVKNLFALAIGESWVIQKKTADHLKKDTLVEVNKPRLSNSTSHGCLTQQAPVVELNKVNSNLTNNNKEKLEIETSASAARTRSSSGTPSLSSNKDDFSIDKKDKGFSISEKSEPPRLLNSTSENTEDLLDWESFELPSQRASKIRRQGDNW